MLPRICECGRSIILQSNKKWSRRGYRRIKGHELCRKCHESLKDKFWTQRMDEQTKASETGSKP